jgi:hypothetical protein
MGETYHDKPRTLGTFISSSIRLSRVDDDKPAPAGEGTTTGKWEVFGTWRTPGGSETRFTFHRTFPAGEPFKDGWQGSLPLEGEERQGLGNILAREFEGAFERLEWFAGRTVDAARDEDELFVTEASLRAGTRRTLVIEASVTKTISARKA